MAISLLEAPHLRQIDDAIRQGRDALQQGQSVVANLLVLDHDKDLVEEVVDRLDQGLECAEEIASFVAREGLKPPFALIGYQPRFAESLAALGELRIVDMDVQHIGQPRVGVKVMAPAQTDEALAGAGCAFVTGSTVVNATIARFLDLPMPTIFFGVTGAGVTKLLGLKRYCPRGG